MKRTGRPGRGQPQLQRADAPGAIRLQAADQHHRHARRRLIPCPACCSIRLQSAITHARPRLPAALRRLVRQAGDPDEVGAVERLLQAGTGKPGLLPEHVEQLQQQRRPRPRPPRPGSRGRAARRLFRRSGRPASPAAQRQYRPPWRRARQLATLEWLAQKTRHAGGGLAIQGPGRDVRRHADDGQLAPAPPSSSWMAV